MLVLLVDIVTHGTLGIFDHLGMSYSKPLNGPGSASFTLALEDLGVAGLRWRDLLAIDGLGVAKTLAYLVDEDDGDVEWFGVAWVAQLNVEQRTVQLQCAGLGSMFAARAKRTDTTWTNADQATIVQDLLEEAQAGVRRDLFVHNVLTPTGILRTRTVPATERHYCGDLITEMGQWINGYDHRYEALWTGGGDPPTHQFNLIFPAPRFTPIATLIATGELAITSWTVDGTTIATDVDAIGNQVVVTVSQPTPLTTYPGIDRSVTHSSTIETATLTAWGQRALQAGTFPRQSGTFRALLGPDDDLPCTTGDTIRLIETDLVGIDAVMTVSQTDVTQAGSGRVVNYTVVDPNTLLRTAEQAL